jgi:DNA-directed RNA polymerase subunit beta'
MSEKPLVLNKLNPRPTAAALLSGTIKEIERYFPFETEKYRLEVSNVRATKDLRVDDLDAQYKARMTKRTWASPIAGDFKIIDKATSRVVAEKKGMSVLKLPHITKRYSYIIDGTEYQPDNQTRLKSGVYARRKANGELESQFNLVKGRGFSMQFEPERKRFLLRYGTINVPLMPVLRALGVSDAEIKKAWGAEAMAEIDAHRTTGALEKMVRAVGPRGYANAPATGQSQEEIIREALGATELLPDTTKITLGKPHTTVDGSALLAASTKLLNINRGTAEPDNRDSYRFKALWDISDHIPERLRNSSRGINRKLANGFDRKAAAGDIRGIVDRTLFQVPVKSFFTMSDLAQQPDQNNPIHMLGGHLRLTLMGTGGIGSEQAITNAAKGIDASQMGFVDPVYTPEGSRSGVTTHLSIGAKKIGNEAAIKVIDARTGKERFVTPVDLYDKTVAFADEYTTNKRGKLVAKRDVVKAIQPKSSDPVEVSAKDVDYVIRSGASMLSVATNLVPFLPSDQSGRAGMADRHLEQTVSLVNREEPLVQVASSSSDPNMSSWEKILGRTSAHFSKVKGTVVRVEPTKIVVRDGKGKEHAEPLYRNFPLNEKKSFLNSEPSVEVGDKVDVGDLLADTNFTRGGTLSMGVNMKVAFLPFKGLVFEDGIVVSETGSKKLTSMHMHKKSEFLGRETEVNTEKFRALYPGHISNDNAEKLEDGVVKVGETLRPGDVIAAILEKKNPTKEQLILKGVHRSLVKPYKDASITWDKPYSGEVVAVTRHGRELKIHIRTEEPVDIGDKLCFDAQTDVLTRAGWKPVSEVTLEDEVCTLIDGHRIVYSAPSELHSYAHGGRMYRIQSQQVDQFVTSAHRMFVQRRGRDEFELLPAEEIAGKRVRYKKDGDWLGESPDAIRFAPERVAAGRGGVGTRLIAEKEMPLQTYMLLLGAYLADGNIVNQPSSGSYGIAITKYKEPHRTQLLDALRDHGVKFSEGSNGQKVVIYSKQLMQHFVQFGHAHEKFIPEWVFDCTRKDLEILFAWLMWGDGHTRHNKPICYTTTSRQLADDVQRLCLHIGKAANIKFTEASEGVIKGVLYDFRPRYSVRVINKKLTPQVNHGHVHQQNSQTEEFVEDYTGEVYCVTVPGHVLYVRRNGKPCWSGNSGRHGNKGVVTAVLPDEEMPHDADGNAIEIIMNPSGVPGRINLGQVLETNLGKAALASGDIMQVSSFADTEGRMIARAAPKTVKVKGHWRLVQTAKGKKRIWIKPYEYDVGYAGMVQKIMDEVGVSDTEDLFDPVTGQKLEDVMVGQQYVIKQTHQSEKKLTARAHGYGHSYDINNVPRSSFGGGDGAQRFGELGLYSMLAHGAVNNIRDAATYKSDRTQEAVWDAIQTGQLPPAPKSAFAYAKFLAYLNVLGVDVEKNGHELTVLPLTDKQITEMSSGALSHPERMVRGKDLAPEEGGLFDAKITGGPGGKRWAHIELKEAIPNPVFERSILALLGLRGKDFDAIMSGSAGINESGKVSDTAKVKGARAIVEALQGLDKQDREQLILKYKKEIEHTRGTKRNLARKRVKFLSSLERAGMSAEEAYTLHNIPVLPPHYRPITAMTSGDLNVDGLNGLYREVALLNGARRDSDGVLPRKDLDGLTMDVYDAVEALMGVSPPSAPGTLTDGTSRPPGVMTILSGRTSPKNSYFHRKLLDRKQDLSMRAVIVPDMDLHLDEVGLPRKAADKIFRPFVVRELVKMGQSPLEARAEIKKQTPLATRALQVAMDKRPVLFKRDPVLHKFGIMGFKAKLVDGKAIHIHPLVTSGFNADFDGDAMAIFVPMGKGAVDEAYRMMPSKNLFSPATGQVMYQPTLEGQLGLFLMSQWGDDTGKSFSSQAAALREARAGKLKMTDVITAGGVKTTAGRIAMSQALPEKARSAALLSDPTRVMDKDTLQASLRSVALNAPLQFAETADKIKDLGFGHSYDIGFSFTMKDFQALRSIRAKHFASAKSKIAAFPKSLTGAAKDAKIIEIYTQATDDLDVDARAHLRATGNKLFQMTEAGVKPSWSQLRQMLVAPMLLTNSEGRTIPVPVERSYSEGLSSAGYWTAAAGARKGLIEKVQSVSEPGALSKQIVNTTIPYVVTVDDCGTKNGIVLPKMDRDITGRALYRDITVQGSTFKAGTIVTPGIMSRIRTDLKIKDVPVRSVHKCEAKKGLCGTCYGTTESGKKIEVGANIGILAGQTIGERGTQLSMKAFHTGGVAGAGSAVMGGLARVTQLLKMPKILPNKAKLADLAGTVDRIEDDPMGGKSVYIGGTKHYTLGGKALKVKKGDIVRKGDALTGGPIDPRELLERTNIGRVQSYLTHELATVYEKEGIKRRNVEVVIKSLTDLGVVNSAGEVGDDAGIISGDYIQLSAARTLNKNPGKRSPIKVTPVLRGVETLALDRTTDWLARMQYRNLRETLTSASNEGWSSDIHGVHPVPGIVFSKEFGKAVEGKDGVKSPY